MIKFTKRIGDLEQTFEAATVLEVIELKNAVEQTQKPEHKQTYNDRVGHVGEVIRFGLSNRGFET